VKQHASVALSTLAVAVTAAHGQDQMTLAWTAVVLPTSGPPTPPQVPGKVSPNEYVEFRATLSFTPVFGTVRTNHLGLTGPVEGFAKAVIDFEASANHNGLFYGILRNPGLGGAPIIEPNRVYGIQVGQFGIVGYPINTSNPLNNCIRIRWFPVDYTPRTVTFTPRGSDLTPIYGELYLNIGGPQGSGTELYTSYRIENANFNAGAPIQIQVIPSPSGMALVGVVALAAVRRRR
jgi:hypothetical protein